MKSVTSGFLAAQNQINTFPVYRVYYKRRYWNGSTNYIWEANWTELTKDKVSMLGTITKQLDTQTFSEFKSSNISLSLLNTDNQWQDGNAEGFFGADGASSLGYEPYLMKFQIRAGFINVGESDERLGISKASAGSEELLTLFTGFAIDWQTNSDSGIMKVAVEGVERLLTNSDAERVSTTITDEVSITANGENRSFQTKNSGVGRVISVKLNDLVQIIGVQYEVSGLNDYKNGASINFSKTPSDGDVIKISYRHWKKNQTVEQFVSDLVSESGISLSSIENATIGSISNYISQTGQSEFEAGTNSNVLTDKLQGAIKVNYSTSDLFNDFNSGDVPANGWIALFVGDPKSWSVTGGELKTFGSGVGPGATQAGALKRAYGYNIGFGEWKFDVRVTNGNADFYSIWFLANADTQNAHDGYIFKLLPGAGTVFSKGQFLRSEPGTATQTIIAEFSVGVQFHSTTTVKILRDIFGEFRIYFNDVFKFKFSDTTYVSGDRMIIDSTPNTSNFVYTDNIRIPPNLITASHQSQTIDTIGGISSWGKLSVDYKLYFSDSVSFETRTSSDGSTWDALIAVSADGTINSAVKRYIQIKITITADTLQANTANPNPFLPHFIGTLTKDLETFETEIYDYTVQFTSDRIFVQIGNFSGMNSHGAVTELAKLTDFEWGLDEDESFFFRSRTTTPTPDVTLAQNTNLVDVAMQKTQYDKLYSIIRATFGSFTIEKVADEDVSTSALEIVGRRVFTISSSILLNQNTDIATPLANTFFERLKSKRKFVKIKTKFFPQIELSDTLSITFKHDAFTAEVVPFVNGLICKVLSTRHNLEGWVSEFDCEEII